MPARRESDWDHVLAAAARQDWLAVADACRGLAVGMLDRLAEEGP